MRAILFLMHCASNTGYAIETLERRFLAVGQRLFDQRHIHFAYPKLDGYPAFLQPSFSNVLVFDPRSPTTGDGRMIRSYLRRHQVDTVFGFDQPPWRPGYRHLRRAGVRRFVSYWGAPMGTRRRGLSLLARRAAITLSWNGPDHYIFESHAMAATATHGRGIPAGRVSVVPLGVDINAFEPNSEDGDYIYRALSIPRNRHIIFFSGHMEPRKGIATIMHAARILCEIRQRRDFHFVLVGDRGDESRPYLALLETASALRHVTFGGYRDDVPRLLRGVYCGVIASTGWDSFTQSSVEMAASGVPLLVSDVGGIHEAIVDGVTGRVLPAGDAKCLAHSLNELLDSPVVRDRMSLAARQHAVSHHTEEMQTSALAEVLRQVTSRRGYCSETYL